MVLLPRFLARICATFVFGVTMSACSQTPATYSLVNLGDSFSAGVGAGGVTQSPVVPDCLHGEGPDHISELDNHPRVEVILNAACSGLDSAAISAVVDRPEVNEALSRAEVVTLTIGGNDVAWVQTILACSTFGSEDACETAILDVSTSIAAAAQAAGTTVEKIADVGSGRILVLGYPHLIDPAPGTLPVTTARAAQVNALTDELNAALRASVESKGATFIDVTDRFAGHGLGSAEPWINLDLSNFSDSNNLHPTQDGYLLGYLPALMAELGIQE
ncbi:SGNH/GDSL hydrolase family protein [Tessaracoccus sp. OS52]|uniref:SGNH/GDSL hydrolase family protein n=1 Tax=Tessaracoccus sp. OS52 TaxID=2886691 RepID=UPI001D11ECB5|nr:SGNH/GDSL hydrolase family protein [Tessaracoccus sp. OS52]MCC2592466.1 SGNH/GDSL hydrolase family protein [Tessaracoccus sp. OS52]